MEKTYTAEEIRGYILTTLKVIRLYLKFTRYGVQQTDIFLSRAETIQLLEEAEKIPTELFDGITDFREYIDKLRGLVSEENLDAIEEILEIQHCL